MRLYLEGHFFFCSCCPSLTFDAVMQMKPGVIALGPVFLGLLRVAQTTAYALQPYFATRLDVYSVSTGSGSCWVPCALLISQSGELYLFSAADGRVINAALLGPVAGMMDTGKARVDVVTQHMPGPGSDMQSLYVRCRQPLQLVNLHEKDKRRDSTTRRSEAVAEGEATPSTVFPPFSYLMRFHCGNVPVVLQLLRIIAAFADPKKGELFIYQAQVPLEEELDISIFVDPLATTPRQKKEARHQDKMHRWISVLRNAYPLKALLSSSKAKGVVYMRDVAKAAKKRLLDAGVRIEVPPPLGSTAPLIPYFMTEFNEANQLLGHTAVEAPLGRSIATGRQGMTCSLEATCGSTTDAALSTISQFYETVMDKIPHFTLSSSEDVLQMYGLPAFEAQFAVLLAQRYVQDLVERCVGRLLEIFSDAPNLPRHRILASGAVREELRWKFGVTYRELCRATRARIDAVPVRQLLCDEERATVQRLHEMAIQELLVEAADRRQKMIGEEADVFFGTKHELMSASTGQPLPPLCAEETAEWRNEVVEAAEALQALEFEVRRIRDSVNSDIDDGSEEEEEEQEYVGNLVGSVAALSSREGRNRSGARFASVKEEEAFLLRRIQREQETLSSLQLKRSSGDQGVSGLLEDDVELKSMRSEYNALILKQQQEIDELKQKLQRSAATLGISAPWLEDQHRRLRLTQEVLSSTYIG
ncbi:hypothetical protein TRSC58_02589 [Trypanosoma rangeli SC58]|uniref:Uncharacterized protein n=1 Tax=Trypanosoma rangeli SC58 TaxID=429131 RepID=A0A061J8T9_TRYRA|nr:hypothetical protein TRSC58_02589 [Trypanosoma rangeli SC58]